MKKTDLNIENPEDDPTAASRKKDHIDLAFNSQTKKDEIDHRFNYEPIISGFSRNKSQPFSFLGKEMRYPIWISSMTGGTEYAATINKNLAQVAGNYGLGMGLGSCRGLLSSDEYLADFQVRKYINDQPLYANLGIAQIEEIVTSRSIKAITDLLDKLEADGLIVHINPLQEWMQPEGDRYYNQPIDTIRRLLDGIGKPVIVKEVGQGMGPKSLLELLKLPIAALDFGAHGGTNFSMLELLRNDEERKEAYACVTRLGHCADEMMTHVNQLWDTYKTDFLCQSLIVSGGVKTFLDGYYFVKKSKMPAVYGQASAFLKRAIVSYDEAAQYVERQVEGLEMAEAFLTLKPEKQ